MYYTQVGWRRGEAIATNTPFLCMYNGTLYRHCVNSTDGGLYGILGSTNFGQTWFDVNSSAGALFSGENRMDTLCLAGNQWVHFYHDLYHTGLYVRKFSLPSGLMGNEIPGGFLPTYPGIGTVPANADNIYSQLADNEDTILLASHNPLDQYTAGQRIYLWGFKVATEEWLAEVELPSPPTGYNDTVIGFKKDSTGVFHLVYLRTSLDASIDSTYCYRRVTLSGDTISYGVEETIGPPDFNDGLGQSYAYLKWYRYYVISELMISTYNSEEKLYLAIVQQIPEPPRGYSSQNICLLEREVAAVGTLTISTPATGVNPTLGAASSADEMIVSVCPGNYALFPYVGSYVLSRGVGEQLQYDTQVYHPDTWNSADQVVVWIENTNGPWGDASESWFQGVSRTPGTTDWSLPAQYSDKLVADLDEYRGNWVCLFNATAFNVNKYDLSVVKLTVQVNDTLGMSDDLSNLLSDYAPPVIENCPDIIVASAYCSGVKEFRSNTLQEVSDGCEAEVFSNTAEQCTE